MQILYVTVTQEERHLVARFLFAQYNSNASG